MADALSVGYRSIDTAQAYNNEKEVGDAIRKSGIPREEIFLTTKVFPGSFGDEITRETVLSPMEKLQMDYLDLVLLHMPYGDTYGAWRALEALYDEGKLRAIGVSNFVPDRLVDLVMFNRIAPMVNQIETHPYKQQKEAIEWMNRYKVQHEAWAPFGEGKNGMFEDPVLTGIGEKYGKSSAQIILRWHLQCGRVVIPKSTHIERMRENFDVFDFALSEDDMAAIASLNEEKTLFFQPDSPVMTERIGLTKGVRKKA